MSGYPQPASIVCDARRLVAHIKHIYHTCRIDDLLGIRSGHKREKIIRDALHSCVVGIAHPYIFPVKGNSSQVTVCIHAKCHKVLSVLPVKYHQLPKWALVIRIARDKNVFIRYTNSLRTLRLTENIIIEKIIFLRLRHARNIYFIYKIVIAILKRQCMRFFITPVIVMLYAVFIVNRPDPFGIYHISICFFVGQNIRFFWKMLIQIPPIKFITVFVWFSKSHKFLLWCDVSIIIDIVCRTAQIIVNIWNTITFWHIVNQCI